LNTVLIVREIGIGEIENRHEIAPDCNEQGNEESEEKASGEKHGERMRS
jgi:hypothetical protein